MHTLDEFENITNEVIKQPKNLTNITGETVDLVEKSLGKETPKVKKENEKLER